MDVEVESEARAMDDLKTADLVIEVREEPTPPTLVLSWRGRSADRYPSRVLGPFFAEALRVFNKGDALMELRPS